MLTPYQGQDRERTLAATEERYKGNCLLELISQIHFFIKKYILAVQTTLSKPKK